MSPDTARSPHTSVMLQECLDYFAGRTLNTFFEGTVGAGGHARAILEAHPEIKRYIGCDQDPEALRIAREVLAPWQGKLDLVQGNFSTLDHVLNERKIKNVDGFFLISESPLCN
jgi:16S rRNA (cytosine1402-N4)-methyltransferase